MQTLEQEILMYKKIDINFYNQRRTAMTNKEAAIVLKQYVSNNFKISGLYAFLHPTINPDKRKTHIESILTDAFQCAYKALARQDTNFRTTCI